MKKILACIFAVSVISTAAFSKNWFSQRFFEVKVGADVDFSNNLFALNDFMKKDLVIDLRKIADECPKNGFNIRADVEPSFALNLNILDFNFGLSSGVQMYESMEFSKDLFDFLGYGNSIGQTMNFGFKNDTDVFAFTQVDVGFKLGRLKIKAQPAIFLPIISIRGGGGSVTVLNDDDGNLSVGMNMNMDVYSISELKKADEGSGVTVDPDKLQSTIIDGYGFDIGGGVTYSFTKTFDLEATCRIPILPGRLNYKSNIQGGSDYNVKLTDFNNSEKTDRETTVTNVKETLMINRPMKLDVYADKDLLGSLFNARAGAGFGIRRPFSDAAVFYPEYYLGFTVNLIDIVKVRVSTEYTDQLFKHELGTTLNVRVVQFDIGVSSQSSSFKKSMAVAGLGGYAYLTMGF